MVNLKNSKIYKFLKKTFFFLFFAFLSLTGKRGQAYYYSKWVAEDGDTRFLFNYPLDSKSLVVDVGGYLGYFSDGVLLRYHPSLIIFEPVGKFYRLLKKKYPGNPKVKIYQLALSNKKSVEKIYLSKDATSLIKKADKSEKIKTIDVAAFVKKTKPIDLMSINIEGSEYPVLERLLKTGLIKRIKFLQVQFHPFIPNAKRKRREIINEILKTHKVRYSYPFVWESFKLKN